MLDAAAAARVVSGPVRWSTRVSIVVLLARAKSGTKRIFWRHPSRSDKGGGTRPPPLGPVEEAWDHAVPAGLASRLPYRARKLNRQGYCLLKRMYFTYTRTRPLLLIMPLPIRLQDKTLFAAVTATDVILCCDRVSVSVVCWLLNTTVLILPCFFALQPRGVIARNDRCPASVGAYGENISVHWRPDATSLAVLVRTVFVHHSATVLIFDDCMLLQAAKGFILVFDGFVAPSKASAKYVLSRERSWHLCDIFHVSFGQYDRSHLLTLDYGDDRVHVVGHGENSGVPAGTLRHVNTIHLQSGISTYVDFQLCVCNLVIADVHMVECMYT